MGGIQLNDAKGNEIGGLGECLMTAQTILCFDTHTAEATCMYVAPLWRARLLGHR